MLRQLFPRACAVCTHTPRRPPMHRTPCGAPWTWGHSLLLTHRTQSSSSTATQASPDSDHHEPCKSDASTLQGSRHASTAWWQRCRFHRPRSRAEWYGMILGGSIFPLSVMAVVLYDRHEQRRIAGATDTDAVAGGDLAPDLHSMQSVTMVPRTQLGGPFRLRESKTGDYITDAELFTNHWTLLYFGFSKCAEICPSTLSFIADVMKKCDAVYGSVANVGGDSADEDERRSAAEAARLQAAFLSIDFIRDSPDVVQRFVSRYDPRVRGLCGTRREVEAAARVWRVYYSSVDETAEEEAARVAAGEPPINALDDTFQFDHSTAIYLVGPDGKMKDFFFKEMGVDDMVDRLGIHFSNIYGFADTRAVPAEASD